MCHLSLSKICWWLHADFVRQVSGVEQYAFLFISRSVSRFDFVGNLIVSLEMIMWSFSCERPLLSWVHNCNHGDRTEAGKEHRSVPCDDCMMDDLWMFWASFFLKSWNMKILMFSLFPKLKAGMFKCRVVALFLLFKCNTMKLSNSLFFHCCHLMNSAESLPVKKEETELMRNKQWNKKEAPLLRHHNKRARNIKLTVYSRS